MSRSGQSGYLSLSDVGYGSVTGIFGANCRHNWFMYFGVRTYTDEQLENMKHATVTYNGQEMSVYDATQTQRSLERAVKKSKRELVGLDEAIKNLPEEQQLDLKLQFQNKSVKLKQQEARLSDFCKQTGLKRDRFREQVFSTDTENGIKRWTKSTSRKAVWGNRKASQLIPESGITHKRKFKTAENTVNMDYIHSEQYRQKFSRLPFHKSVQDNIYENAKMLLKRRDGTYFEDICLFDSATGKMHLISYNHQTENEVHYSRKAERFVAEHPNTLIAMHNHGTNNPPTGSDFVSAGARKYKTGIVICHDGSVYIYCAGKKPFTRNLFDNSVDKYKKYGYNERESIINVLNDFSKQYGIEWSEL